MKIAGRFDVYECKWRVDGFTYARVLIYKTVEKRNIFGFKSTELKKVWDTGGPGYSSYRSWALEKALPDYLRKIFRECVEEYETYKEAWDKENAVIEVDAKYVHEVDTRQKLE